jgi:hypothetical protein
MLKPWQIAVIVIMIIIVILIVGLSIYFYRNPILIEPLDSYLDDTAKFPQMKSIKTYENSDPNGFLFYDISLVKNSDGTITLNFPLWWGNNAVILRRIYKGIYQGRLNNSSLIMLADKYYMEKSVGALPGNVIYLDNPDVNYDPINHTITPRKGTISVLGPS